MKILSFQTNSYDENAYLVVRSDDVTIIDPGFNFDSIDKYLTENNLKISRVLLTHGHADHIGELAKFMKKYDFKTYINELDVPFLSDEELNCSKGLGIKVSIKNLVNVFPVNDKDEIDGFIFYHSPGHTQGSSLIQIKDILFTGDTLFQGSIGRTDLPTGSLSALNQTLKMIVASFSKKTIILPGHYRKTTLKDEIQNNPYLKRIKKDGKK